jgi:hypothetical protein
MNEEIQAQFDRAKQLAKEIWFDERLYGTQPV